MWNQLLKLFILFLFNVYCNADSSVSPLTKLRSSFACHKETKNLLVACEIGHRIRVLDSFYAVSIDKTRDYCKNGPKDTDCKSYTNLQNVCNGKQACSVNLFEEHISECNAKSDYLTFLYECIPETKVHSVCSNIEDYSTWGTIQTTDFPQPYASNENCWCKLTSNQNQRIVLSVIAFQLFPYDPTCSEAGLYLQSDRKKNKECTLLQQGHYYISSSSNLFLNFYSKRSVVRGGFWLIYEAGDSESKIHLKCGDTDEVRPTDFTRFSQVDKIFTTNYLFDLNNVSSSTSSILSSITSRNSTNVKSSTRFSLGKDTNNYRPAATTTKGNSKILSAISTFLSQSITQKPPTRTFNLSKPLLIGLEHLFNRTTLSHLKYPIKNDVLSNKKETSIVTSTATTTASTVTTSTTTTTTTTTSNSIYKSTSDNPNTVTPFTVKLKKFTLKIPGLISDRRFNKSSFPDLSELMNVAEIFNATNRTNEDLMSMIGYLENEKKSTSEANINASSIFEKKLGKTELTIIISCVLFITLLTFVNLIIYALRKVVKRTSREVSQANLTDKGKKSYDILPGVGEIILWAAKDKRGYLIDINGSWAKIDGQRWIRENMAVLHNTYKKASMAYRNRFRKKDDKKYVNKEDDRLIKGPPPTNGACSLPPVPELAEYEASENTSSVSTIRGENQGVPGSEYQSAKVPPSTSETVYNIDPSQGSAAYQIQSLEMVTSDGEVTDSNYYQERQETWQNSNFKGFNHHIQMSREKSLSPTDILPPPPPIMMDGTSETVSSSDDTESAFIIKRPILIRGDADFLKNFPCNYANEMSESGLSDGQSEFDAFTKKSERFFQKATEHIQNENAIKTIQMTREVELQKISEQVEPPGNNLKHARIIAQPLQRNTSDIILPETSSANTTCVTNLTNTTTVKLDPSILKYTNQPVAIVAPNANKSNNNSLEKKKLHSNEGITTNLSLGEPVNINNFTTDSEYEYSRAQLVNEEAKMKTCNPTRTANLVHMDSVNERKTEYVVGNVQNCVDNGKILLKASVNDAPTLKTREMKEIAYRDSGFLDYNSICSSTTLGSTLTHTNAKHGKQTEQEIKRNFFRAQHTKSLKKNAPAHKYDDGGLDKESSSSDIDEIARFNQMELRRQAIRIKKRNTDRNSSLNTVPKPKPRACGDVKQQPLDARNLIYEYLDNKPMTTDEIASVNHQRLVSAESDVYQLSPLLNSCGLIMCSSLPTPGFHSFIPASLIPISFPNGQPTASLTFLQQAMMQQQNDEPIIMNSEAATIKKRVTFASANQESLQDEKVIKKSYTFQERTRHELEEAAQAWQKRQASKSEYANETEPPLEVSFHSQECIVSQNVNSEEQNDVNSDEFQFFMNAIEKLKAANLFHEDDLKKMTDEQIYEALIEHARMQKKAKDVIVVDNMVQSIDKEEEDLPIIMRNLHSVKSLKHYFEIKAKASASEHAQCSNSPLLSKTAKMPQEKAPENIQVATSDDLKKTENTVEEVQQEHVVVSVAPSFSQPPAPPPLPDDLFRISVDTSARNSLLKHSESYKKRKGSIEIQQSCCSPTPFTEHRDLHEKLIKEIHNKSMERSRKETNICLDEQGNLIHKPVGRVYTSVKNQKLYRIKDNASISSVEIKEFPRLEHLKNANISKSVNLLKNSSSFEATRCPTKIEVVVESTATDENQSNKQLSFVCIEVKSASNINSTVLATNLSENSELNEPCEITQSFVSQNNSTSDLISLTKPSDLATSTLKELTGSSVHKSDNRMCENNAREEILVLNKTEDDENDQLSELISISQVPSVFPSIDRKEPVYKSSSFKTDSFNLEAVQEMRRTMSFKSDASGADTVSLKSTRSMLSEAKAKLELLSAKISKNTDSQKGSYNKKQSTKSTSTRYKDSLTATDDDEEVTQF